MSANKAVLENNAANASNASNASNVNERATWRDLENDVCPVQRRPTEHVIPEEEPIEIPVHDTTIYDKSRPDLKEDSRER